MDYRFTDEEESFRAEVREFLRAELPEDWDFDPFELTEDKWDFARQFTTKLATKGWVAPAWPQEYGGQGMPYMQQVVLSEEIAYHRAPNTSLIGVTYAGPTIIVYGNDDQKKQFLPGSLPAVLSGARAIQNPTPAPTSPPSRPALSRTATTTSSTGRRSGPRTLTRPTGASSSPAPIRKPLNTKASLTSSPLWTRPASASARS